MDLLKVRNSKKNADAELAVCGSLPKLSKVLF
jgi:hypothetical protein